MSRIPRRCSPKFCVPLGVLLTLLSCAAGIAADIDIVEAPGDVTDSWPRWWGPSGQGHVVGAGYVDRWSQEENVLWRTEVPGRGNSSPIVWEDRIFLTTARGDTRSVLSFSRQDGRLLWQVAAPPATAERAHQKNSLASSTPTTDGERVYAYFGNHGLMAVTFDGQIAWHKKLGPFDAYHGTASSPFLYRDRVILVQDHQGSSGSFIAAFDKKTGETLWRTPRSARVGWNSPIVISTGERDEIIMSGQQQVTAYDPANGRELWWAKGNTVEVIPTPVAGHDMVFCSSGRAGPTLAIRPGGSGDVTSSHIAWRSPKGSPFVPAPILVGDYLYMVNDMASVLTVYDAREGQVVWQHRLGEGRREGFSAAPVAVSGKVFFTNDYGETFVVKTGPEFELLHTNDLSERVLASPALVGGVWYIRGEQHLYAIGREER